MDMLGFEDDDGVCGLGLNNRVISLLTSFEKE